MQPIPHSPASLCWNLRHTYSYFRRKRPKQQGRKEQSEGNRRKERRTEEKKGIKGAKKKQTEGKKNARTEAEKSNKTKEKKQKRAKGNKTRTDKEGNNLWKREKPPQLSGRCLNFQLAWARAPRWVLLFQWHLISHEDSKALLLGTRRFSSSAFVRDNLSYYCNNKRRKSFP